MRGGGVPDESVVVCGAAAAPDPARGGDHRMGGEPAPQAGRRRGPPGCAVPRCQGGHRVRRPRGTRRPGPVPQGPRTSERPGDLRLPGAEIRVGAPRSARLHRECGPSCAALPSTVIGCGTIPPEVARSGLLGLLPCRVVADSSQTRRDRVGSMPDLAAAVARQIPRAVDDVVRLVAIPSVSSQPDHAADVDATARAVADHLTELGCPDVQIVAEGGKPAVIGRFEGPAGAPRVCLYAHHDVQPVGDPAIWENPGFEATRRGDRLFGRGAADDKGGIGVHLAALRAFSRDLPVGVTVFVEGEEEIGSPSLGAIIAAHSEQLRADAYVITDSGNWDVGVPAFTTTLRGVCDCVVEVATLDHAIHSGQYGGIVPDAVTALCRLLATLHHEDGSVAVDGLVPAPDSDLDYPEDRLRAESGVLDGVAYLGSGSITSRIWSQPSITVIGIDAPSVAEASNTLFPSAQTD